MENLLLHVGTLEDEFKKYKESERNNYKDVFDVIKSYCKNSNSILISDINQILDDYIILDKLSLYSFNFKEDSKNITDLLYKKLNDKFTNYNLVSEHLAIIKYKFRTVCEIHAFGLEKIDTKLLTPIIKKSDKLLPPEIEIIKIYNDLYDLETDKDDIDNLLELEDKLIEKICTRKEQKVFGGKNKLKNIDFYKHKIMTELVKNSDNVLVSDSINVPKYDIKIITKNPKLLIKELHNLIGDIFIYKKINIIIPQDPLIEIINVYINIDGKKYKFLSLYNETKYKPIAVRVIKGYNVANKYTYLKYLFIDFWNIRILYYNGKIQKQTYEFLFDKIWNLILSTRKQKNITEKYIGSYINSTVYNKIKNLDLNPPYYPFSK